MQISNLKQENEDYIKKILQHSLTKIIKEKKNNTQ
jgi:hypothetical protein